MSDEGPKQVVARIRAELEAARGSRIWPEYIRALNLISQVVFTRSAGFVLELVQNAEDAGKEGGEFVVSVKERRVKIVHDGRPFDAADAEALCGIRSSKKPEQGTLGYLGIGFKSVFKVTDAPEMYSGGYRFKFDKHDPAWAGDPGSVPWHVIPIWMERPSEEVDERATTFILPLRERNAYGDLVAELRRLDTGLFLFLRRLACIRLVNEETGEEQRLENLGEDAEGITTLRQGSRTQRFKVFRKTVLVPDRVRDDDLTRTYRKDVRQREIALAFAIGPGGELDPGGAGGAFGGVYSFVPLGEARSGARFRIQADFLVQPGRDAVNHESRWNQWLVREVATLAREALSAFSDHATWKFQFLPVFEFSRSPGIDAHDHLFGPLLIDPVEDAVRKEAVVPTVGGGKGALESVVRVAEGEKAVQGLEARGLVGAKELAEVLARRPGVLAVHPAVVNPSGRRIPEVSRWDLLGDAGLMADKARGGAGPEWFRKLYLWLHEHPWHEPLGPGRKSREEKRYYHEEIVLGDDGKLHAGGSVLLPVGLPASPVLAALAEEMKGTKPMCHPGLFEAEGEPGERGRLIGFLTGKCGVQKLDAARICREWVVPKIAVTADVPEVDALLQYTRVCVHALGTVGIELWVLTKEGHVRPAKEVLFSADYHPPHCWEPLAGYLPSAAFLSPAYLEGRPEGDELAEWRTFFASAGVKLAPANGVEEVAMNFAEEALGREFMRVSRVELREVGFDLEAENAAGEVIRVEVKGLSTERDIDLTPNETRAAETYGESYWLCVVAPIPHKPTMHMIPNPTAPGRGARYALKVPATVWREAKWPRGEKRD